MQRQRGIANRLRILPRLVFEVLSLRIDFLNMGGQTAASSSAVKVLSWRSFCHSLSLFEQACLRLGQFAALVLSDSGAMDLSDRVTPLFPPPSRAGRGADDGLVGLGSTQATRMRRRMMPTTLATTSRNESKLNSISRTLRRRRIMVRSGSHAGDDAAHTIVGVQITARFCTGSASRAGYAVKKVRTCSGRTNKHSWSDTAARRAAATTDGVQSFAGSLLTVDCSRIAGRLGQPEARSRRIENEVVAAALDEDGPIAAAVDPGRTRVSNRRVPARATASTRWANRFRLSIAAGVSSAAIAHDHLDARRVSSAVRLFWRTLLGGTVSRGTRRSCGFAGHRIHIDYRIRRTTAVRRRAARLGHRMGPRKRLERRRRGRPAFPPSRRTAG